MGTHYSPRTVTDGLVFAFDTGNSKSYKGEPTTNQYTNPTFNGNTTGWSFGSWNGNTAYTTETVVGPSGESITALKLTQNAASSVAHFHQGNGGKYVNGTTYTLSAWVKGSGTFRGRSQWGTNIAFTLTGSWQYVEYTTTAPNSTQYPYWAADNLTQGTVMYMTYAQSEAKPHATPFINGTRSVTESLFDQTKNTTLDLTNVSFDSNAQITFDGTDDYIDLGDLGLGAGPFTVEAIIYPPLASTYHVFFRKGDDSNSNDNMDWCIGYDYDQFHVRAQNSSVYVNDYAGGSFVNSNGYVVLTYNGDTMRMYKNGVEVLNKAVTFANNHSNYSIGRGINNFAQLDVKNIKVYNRALSADEVQQNYNALKGRFGL